MYKLLVADDEPLIRQGLIARLSFLQFEFEEIYEASNGLEALELVMSHPVDIVISDIRMPDMDGLAFIARARDQKPRLKFILLSGYAEFTYAKEAIVLGVKAYLLKPLSNTELKKVMDEVIGLIEQEKKVKRLASSKKRLLKEQSGYLLEKEINALVTEQNQEDGPPEERYPFLQEHYPQVLKRGGSLYRDKVLFFGIIQIGLDGCGQSGFTKKDSNLIRFSIKNVMDEIVSSCEKIVVNNLVNSDQVYAVFIMEQGIAQRDKIERIFLKLHTLFYHKMAVPLTLGVSMSADRLSAKCRREAKEALKQRLLHGEANIFFYEDRKVLEGNGIPVSELHMLEHYMERRDIEDVRSAIRRIFSRELLEKYGAVYIHIMWVRILNMTLHNFSSELTQNGGMEELLSSFSLVEEAASVEELAEAYYHILVSCMQEDGFKDTNAKNKVRLAISYMEQNYAQNIVINELAERFGMSPNYFSSMFKKEMDQSAVNYLTTLRVEKAAEYLADTEESVADISRRVGYEDSQYFFRVFKKVTGMTPLMYRKEHKNEVSKAD